MSYDDVSSRATALRQVVKLIQDASETLISEWENPAPDAVPASETSFAIPGRQAYDAQRTIIAALGSVEELVAEPHLRLVDFAELYFEVRALHIALQHDIAILLAKGGADGVPVEELAKATGLDRQKLSRLLRALTTQHFFREVGPDRFANNRITQALVNDEKLQAQTTRSSMGFAAASALPEALIDPVRGPSQNPEDAAWPLAVGTKLPFFDWMNEKVPLSRAGEKASPGAARGFYKEVEPSPDEELVPRDDTKTYNLYLVGNSKSLGSAHLYDFPWKELGNALVVDVGGGVGSFDLQLARLYPELRFVVQDQVVATEQGVSLWQKEFPEALESGRTKFLTHDFFTPNPVKEADIYWMRHVLHDWKDDDSAKILAMTAGAMGPKSRLLVADITLTETIGDPYIKAAPKPLLANYGIHGHHGFALDIAMMSLMNGKERTPSEFRNLFEKAGLKMVKVWECRSNLGIIECRLA
ncbi:putative O-methyltransferase [Annulohypoxylon maeteangense]|uniref:putative O-methyltransferase n=1 Tax=Annulohypoxylon maeteangense TaxID=1927788 RepID=UPI00200771A0|nr:putative O-methyltransferase [Annulohypoxylon maeteangense]KAI0885554.1 putative O-methyltransferase [Annulohypoxylon maeteangense]